MRSTPLLYTLILLFFNLIRNERLIYVFFTISDNLGVISVNHSCIPLVASEVWPYEFLSSSCNFFAFYLLYNRKKILLKLLLHILHNPVSCGADGFLGDAHDAVYVAVFHAHFVEDEEESVMGGLGLIFLLEAAEGGEVDGFVIVDEAFAVVVRPAGGSSSFLILFSPEIFAFYPLYKIIIFVVLDYYLYLCTHKSIKLCHSLHGNIRFHKAATG